MPLFLGLVLAGCASNSRPFAGLGFSGDTLGPDPQRSARVITAGPDARWQESPQDVRRPLTPGLLLPEGAIVDSDSAGNTVLGLPGNGGLIKLAANTRIVLGEMEAETVTAVFVARGEVAGSLRAGCLHMSSAGGGSLLVTPDSEAEMPFNFGSGPSTETFNTLIGLGLNPDVMLPPLPSEAAIDSNWGPQTYVSSIGVVVPEPATLGLLGLGLMALVAAAHRRPRS